MEFLPKDKGVSPDTSNIKNKREFTFLIEAFLKHAVKSAETSFNEFHYDELMELWEKW